MLRGIQVLGRVSSTSLYWQYSKRSFGITDTISNFANRKMEATKEQQFGALLDAMSKANTWSLLDWKTTMDQQLSSWMTYIPGVSNSPQMKDLKSFQDILGKLKKEELEDVSRVDKERVARETGKSVEDINKMILGFKQSRIIQQWLQTKKKNGEKLPTTEEELYSMQENDVRIKTIARNEMTGAAKRTGRGKRLPF